MLAFSTMLQDNILRYKDNQQNDGYSNNPFSAVLHHTLQLETFSSEKSGKTYEEPICFKLQVVLITLSARFYLILLVPVCEIHVAQLFCS